jgi:hypothetical protein
MGVVLVGRVKVDDREEGVMIETNFLGLESLELKASMGGWFGRFATNALAILKRCSGVYVG